MKKTNRELAEFYGIEEGDIVEVETINDVEKYEVMDLNDKFPLKNLDTSDTCVEHMGLNFLINREYKIIKPKKKIGETCCNDYLSCKKCPLGILKCNSSRTDSKSSLYETLNDICSNYSIKLDNPIYLALKAELDKEVE